MPKFDLKEVPEFYHKYINLVQGDDLQTLFNQHQKDLLALLTTIPEERWEHRYAAGKWSIKEVVQHIIDAERIFNYRSLRFARKDNTPLPGFDENEYTTAAKADARQPSDLMKELEIVQKSSALLFNSFDEEQMNCSGIANNNQVTVRGIGYIIIGHTLHHKRILEEKYL